MVRLAKMMNPWKVFLCVLFMGMYVLSMLMMPTLTANIIDYGVAEGDISYIIRMGMIMIVFALLSIIFAVLNVVFASQEAQGLGHSLRKKIYRLVTYFTNEELDKFGASTLITRTTNDVAQIEVVMIMILRVALSAPIMMIGAGFLAYSREPQLAFIFLITLPILVGVLLILLKLVGPIFRSLQKKTDTLNRIFRENLTGIRVIRAFNKSGFENERFDKANKDFSQTSIKAFTILAWMSPAMILIMSLTNILITWFGAQYISIGQMQVGNMVAFMTYAVQILMGVVMVSMVLFFLPRGQVAASRIIEVLDTPNLIKDPKHALPVEKGEASLEFKNVNFRYTGAEKLALKEIVFKVEKGERVAIIGGTGSGKTTLANLISRLYDIEEGQILINGKDIRDIAQSSLRELIGYAPQKAILFSGTIRENLSYGRKNATDEEIWHALEIAQGKEFVSELSGGLDSHVEQGGGNFSGGQRQRLSIARALVTKAPLLVFDDSFSALDFKTDAKLREALYPETRQSAVIVISQRISTVMDADQILVLENGEVAGKGTHEELKNSNKVYKEIMDSQLKGEDM